MFDFLPYELRKFATDNRGTLYELRLRKNCHAVANIKGVYAPVIYCGDYITSSAKDIENIVLSACENSLYNYNECLKKGYVTAKGGIRIGIGGECVTEKDDIITIKNFSSLCIRFPNEAKGCSQKAYEIITSDNYVKNTLVISPPSVGKTTLLRDLAKTISTFLKSNILVVDEKNELIIGDFQPFYTIDYLSGGSKKFGFYNAIKNLSPDIIIADELTCKEDVDGAMFAANSGVKVICSVHGKSFEDVSKKDFISHAIKSGIFECFILLEKSGVGFTTIEVKNND